MLNLSRNQEKPQLAVKSDWKLWEADLLVNAGLSRQLVTVFLPESGETVQSFIHGFDLDTSELLLDGLFPHPKMFNSNTYYETKAFWVQIRGGEGLYTMEVQLLEVLGSRGHELVSVKVLQGGLSGNRRWRTRIYFDARQGPQVELQLDEHPIITGHVANLSNQGAMLEVYGKDLKTAAQIGKGLRARYKFNDHFQLELRGVLKQSRFLRSPCCHSQLRVQFMLMPAETRAQLDTYIHSIAAPDASVA